MTTSRFRASALTLLALLRRASGLVLALLVGLPLYRLIQPERSGPWGAATIAESDRAFDISLWGTVTMAGLAAVIWVWARRRHATGGSRFDVPAWLHRGGSALAAIPAGRFAAACGAVAFALAALLADRVFLRLLTNVDEMTSVIHARYLAAGLLGGATGESAEAWLVPNMLVTDVGWVSQYPPGQLLMLAVGEKLGALWLTGPVLLGAMVAFSCLAAARLLSDRPLEARLGGVLLTLSPFVVIMGAGALSHLAAGAAISAALYFALRARDGSVVWGLPAGLAMGVAVLSRPWTGLILGGVLTLGLWLWQFALERGAGESAAGDLRSDGRRPGSTKALAHRTMLWIVGGLPAALLLIWYNGRVFGSPTNFGYEVLYGPAHGLGFHLDPWGYPYGLRAALGYSSADLVRFGAGLLETPIPLTLVVAFTLMLAPRLGSGAGVLAAWAIAPVLANALYWFHHPRMLFESAPGWIWLAVVGVGMGLRSARPGPRAATAATVVVSLVVGVWAFAPGRVSALGWTDEALSRISVPSDAGAATDPGGTIVFVHTSWAERVAGRLQAAAMRGDSLQSILRRNDMCALDRHGRRRRGEAVSPLLSLDRTLDLTQTSDSRPGLATVQEVAGAGVARMNGVAWTPACEREARADRFGTVSLAPLLWQGALPGLDQNDPRASAPLFVRDYGPEANAALLRRFPERRPLVFTPTAPDRAPSLEPYRVAMQQLWGAPGS